MTRYDIAHELRTTSGGGVPAASGTLPVCGADNNDSLGKNVVSTQPIMGVRG
jgi:hypothetical protein